MIATPRATLRDLFIDLLPGFLLMPFPDSSGSARTSRGHWLHAVFNRRMLICVFLGFSSGLPLFFLLNLVPAWLRSEQLDLKAIGLLALIQLPYPWKFLWAPLVDRYALPLGRRRGWMLLSQIGLLVSMGALGSLSPVGLIAPGADIASWLAFLLHPITLVAFAVALCSATQDIALDAFRREILPDAELGLGSSINVSAYRVAGLVPGSLSLILADHLPWATVFAITALFMLPGLVLTLLVREPLNVVAPKSLRAAVIEPFFEFIGRAGWRQAAWVLAFILCYKLGDALCTALATPFYLDMGYSKTEIGLIAKNAGLWGSIGGGLVGGVLMLRLGIARALWLFGAVQMLSILGFAWLAMTDLGALSEPTRLAYLGVVVGLEAIGVGVGSAAFSAFIAAQTHPAYTATQFALFTSLMAVPRTLISATAGYLVDTLGWFNFYLLCFALALPGMLMLLKVAPWNSPDSLRSIPSRTS